MDLRALHNFRVAACDLNGQMRGKRVPPAMPTNWEKAPCECRFRH